MRIRLYQRVRFLEGAAAQEPRGIALKRFGGCRRRLRIGGRPVRKRIVFLFAVCILLRGLSMPGGAELFSPTGGIFVDAAAQTLPEAQGRPMETESPWNGQYEGYWECIGIDPGTGNPVTSYMGADASEMMRLQLGEDFSARANAVGVPAAGQWRETEGGVELTLDSVVYFARVQKGQMVINQADGVYFYLAQAPRPQNAFVLESAEWDGVYPGEWVCVGIDDGSGIISDSINGVEATDFMRISLSPDGVMKIASVGGEFSGIWRENADGVSMTANGETLFAAVRDGMLALDDGAMCAYLVKVSA